MAGAGLLAHGAHAQTSAYLIHELGGTGEVWRGLAGGADLDGDGRDDLLVGRTAGPAGGKVTAFSGATGQMLFDCPSISSASDAFGASIAMLGDVTGDGVPDFLVGEPSFTAKGLPSDLISAGRAIAFSGADRSPLYHQGGTQQGEQLGYAMVSVGDVDGDGSTDALVGAPGTYYGVAGHGGQVRLISGAHGLLVKVFTPQPGEFIGYGMTGLGDVDLDGVPDVAVSAYSQQQPGDSVRAYSGASGAAVPHLTFFPGSAIESLRSVGDLDLDGTLDLAVGLSWATPPAGSGQGFVDIRSGATGAQLTTLLPANLTRLGRSLDALGDVTGDGIADVLVGSCDSAHVYSGANGARVIDVPAGVGSCPSSMPTYLSVARLGHLDADGVIDFAVAATRGDPISSKVRVVSTAGIPLGSTLYGQGCAAAGGTEPRISVGVGPPTSQFGNPHFGVFLTEVPAGKTALLLEGVSYQSWQGLPLPFDLAVLGMDGCDLWVSVEFVQVRQTYDAGNSNGQAFAPLPVPAQPGLTGAIVHFQWYVLDPGPLPFPGTLSRALQLYVQ